MSPLAWLVAPVPAVPLRNPVSVPLSFLFLYVILSPLIVTTPNTPSAKLGIGDDYDYEQVSLKVTTDVEVFGLALEPTVKLTWLDNDVDIPALEADSQTSVWFGFTYKL